NLLLITKSPFIMTSFPEEKAEKILYLLHKNRGTFAPVMDFPSQNEMMLLNLSGTNLSLIDHRFESTNDFDFFVSEALRKNGALVAVGGYLEHRIIYRRSELFGGVNNRFIHLGVDIWASAFSAVYAPMEGTIHSFKDNAGFGDYGPAIILEHRLEDIVFYTLY